MHICRTCPTRPARIRGIYRTAMAVFVSVTLAIPTGCGSKTSSESEEKSESVAGQSVSETDAKTDIGNPVPPAPKPETLNINPAFDLIPNDSFAAALIRPQEILNSEFVKASLASTPGLLDIEKNNFKQETGIDPNTIGAVVVMAWPGTDMTPSQPNKLDAPKLPELPGGLDSPGCQGGAENFDLEKKAGELPPTGLEAEEHQAFTGGAVLVLTKAVTIEDLGEEGETHEFNGRSYRSKGGMAYAVIDPTTIVFAEEAGIKKILSAEGKSAVAEQLKTLNLDRPITLTIRREQAEVFIPLLDIPGTELILAAIEAVTLQASLGSELAITAAIDTNNADVAAQLKQMADVHLSEFKDAVPTIIGPHATNVLGQDSAKSAIDMSLAVLNSTSVLAEGNRIEAKVQFPAGSGEILKSLLFDTAEQVPPEPSKGPKLPPEPNPIKGLD